jgi:osmotically-inducible protein OsmY
VFYRRPVAAALIAIAAAGSLSGCAATAIGVGASAGTAAAEERGLDGAFDDTKVRTEINHYWFQKSFDLFRKVGLTISEGRVLLTGVVPDENTRADAVRLAWQAAGVKEVYNEIEVVPSGEPFWDESRDTVISQKLKARLMFDKEISNINYSIDVVNGVVYLMGIAQHQSELDRVVAHARDIANVKRVISHVVLKDDPRRVGG